MRSKNNNRRYLNGSIGTYKRRFNNKVIALTIKTRFAELCIRMSSCLYTFNLGIFMCGNQVMQRKSRRNTKREKHHTDAC